MPKHVTAESLNQIVIDGLGVTDDEARIEAALALSWVQRAVIPSGITALTAGLVTVPAGKTLVIEAGAKLLKTGVTTGQPLRLSAGSVLAGGGTVDAAGAANTCLDIAGAGAVVRGMKLINAKLYAVQNSAHADLRVEDCEFSGNVSYALLAENAGSVRTIFTRNRVAGKRGVMIKAATDAVIADNLIALDGTGVGIEVFGTTAARATISGNLVTNPAIGISLATAVSCTITGNTVTGAASIGIENAEGATGNTISGNTIADGTGTGIAVTSGAAGAKPHAEVNISGNTIRNMGSYGINIEYGRNTCISNNTIVDTTSYPVFCNNAPASLLIASNIIQQTDGAGNQGIRVTGAGHLIQGNHIDFTLRADLTSTEGMRIEGGSKSLVASNYVRGAATGISVNGSAGAVLNNNRTDGSTTASVSFNGAGAATAILLTHISAIAGGVVVNNTAGATATGPLVTVS